MPAWSTEPGNPATTIGAALRWAMSALAAVADRPAVEAELLLAALLGRPRPFLLAHPEAPLTAEQAARYTAWVVRRAGHEPLPYITGRVEFYGLEFTVTPAVLIPRPETELLVDEALAWLASRPAPRAVDVGTGSGCIAVTLAVYMPTLRLVAVDLSRAALTVAQANSTRHGVAGQLLWVQGDLLTPVGRPVDLIISNPPYVAESEWAALPPSVQREPRLALLAGPEGLAALRRILAQAPARLRPGGLLLAEIGERQGQAAQALARAAFPRAEVVVLPDLAGRDRLLQIRT